MDEFRSFAGDGFVRSQRDGGSLILILNAETENESQRKKIEANFSANICRMIDLNTEVESISEALEESSSVSIYLSQIGGTQLEAIINFEEAVTKIRKFPIDVSDSPVTYAFEAVDYGVVPRPPGPNYVDIEYRNHTIEYCGQIYRLLRGIQNDIYYIISHRDQFVNVSNYPLDEYNSKINQDLNTIKDAASLCVNNIPACRRPEPDDPIRINYELPSRREPSGPGPTISVIPWETLQQRTVQDGTPGNEGTVTSTIKRRGNSTDLIIRGRGNLALNRVNQINF